MNETYKKFTAVVVLILVTVLLTFCGIPEQETKSEPAKLVDVGKIEDYIYTNDYFSFSVDLPYDWYTMSQQEMREVARQGGRMITGGQQNIQAALKASEPNHLYMFMVLEFPPGTPGRFNPSFTCIGEKVSMFPGIQNGRDYILNMQKILSMGNVQIEFDEEIYIENLGGVEFHHMRAMMQFGNITIYSDYYSSVINGYAVGFVLTYVDDEQEQVLMDSIGSVQFYV